jgi:methyl coenzyme M reductase alpha subunit
MKIPKQNHTDFTASEGWKNSPLEKKEFDEYAKKNRTRKGASHFYNPDIRSCHWVSVKLMAYKVSGTRHLRGRR